MVSAALGLPYTTVADHPERAERNGLGWPLPETMDDRELEERLFAREPSPRDQVASRSRTGRTSTASCGRWGGHGAAAVSALDIRNWS